MIQDTDSISPVSYYNKGIRDVVVMVNSFTESLDSQELIDHNKLLVTELLTLIVKVDD